MSIALETARKVTRSLMGLDDRPATPEAFDALAAAFQLCVDKAEAESIADNILRDSTNRSVPKPGDIYTIIRNRRSQAMEWRPVDTSCPDCHGNGWVIVTINGVEGAKRCACKTKMKTTGVA